MRSLSDRKKEMNKIERGTELGLSGESLETQMSYFSENMLARQV